MKRKPSSIVAAGLLAATLFSPAASADGRPDQQFAQKASWRRPSVETVREQVFHWLSSAEIDDEPRAQAEALWESAATDGNTDHLLDLVCATFAVVDPQARDLVDLCSKPRQGVALPDVAWLADDKRPAVERHNLRLVYARWMVQESLYDEALDQLKGLEPIDVVDPAALLFYQSVVHHRMLQRDEGLTAIGRLLENADQVPRRYASIARLMQADLEGLKEDSLDHIARRMDDIRRRLDLGRAGPKVRSVEDGVIASLDKLIEEIEKQQQQAAAAAAGQQGGQQKMPLQPLPDSRPMGGKGEGKVANKPVGDKSGWGDLPPKERLEALQQIGKEFPAHYRDMIEQYFRKLATESENTDK
jgi:hypothetical protein